MSIASSGVSAPSSIANTYRSADPLDDDGDDDMDDADDERDPSDAGDNTGDMHGQSGVYFSGDDGQRLALRQDTISLDQARRLAAQSIARRKFT